MRRPENLKKSLTKNDVCSLMRKVKTSGTFFQIFVAFSENRTLRYLLRLSHLYLQQFHPHMKPKPFEALGIYFQFHPLFLGNVLSRLNLNMRKKPGMSLIVFFLFKILNCVNTYVIFDIFWHGRMVLNFG